MVLFHRCIWYLYINISIYLQLCCQSQYLYSLFRILVDPWELLFLFVCMVLFNNFWGDFILDDKGFDIFICLMIYFELGRRFKFSWVRMYFGLCLVLNLLYRFFQSCLFWELVDRWMIHAIFLCFSWRFEVYCRYIFGRGIDVCCGFFSFNLYFCSGDFSWV